MDVAELKRQGAHRAVEFIESHMVVGLGVGSTAIWAVRRIAELLQAGELRDIVGVPCALQVEEEARQLGIPLTTLSAHPRIDITIDGADEVDPQMDLIKGGGGALLREKIVAQASQREVIVVDESKLVPVLGTHWPLPIEVVPFGWAATAAYVASLGGEVKRREGESGEPYGTDQGNYILDARFGPIERPAELAARLKEWAGIVEHGLFLGLATDLIVAGAGGMRHIQREDA
jgi:ribose 5-phosphate isomerase A